MNQATIDALLANAQKPKAESWIQKEEVELPDGEKVSSQTRPAKGDFIAGTVLSKNVATNKFGKQYPVVELAVEGASDEELVGKELVVFGLPTFLHDLFGVEVDDQVVILFEGKGEAKGDKKPPYLYRVAAQRDGEPIRLSSKPPAVAAPALAPAPDFKDANSSDEEPF